MLVKAITALVKLDFRCFIHRSTLRPLGSTRPVIASHGCNPAANTYCRASSASASPETAAASLLVTGAGAIAAEPAAGPTKAVTRMAPYASGGGTDIIARLVGSKLSEIWGQPVIVENKASANVVLNTQAEFRTFLEAELVKWTEVAKAGNIQAQ